MLTTANKQLIVFYDIGIMLFANNRVIKFILDFLTVFMETGYSRKYKCDILPLAYCVTGK